MWLWQHVLRFARLDKATSRPFGGTVQDSSTAAVQSADIMIRAKETGAVRTVRSNARGLYEVVSLLPGAYIVETIATGFEASAREVRLEVAAGAAFRHHGVNGCAWLPFV